MFRADASLSAHPMIPNRNQTGPLHDLADNATTLDHWDWNPRDGVCAADASAGRADSVV